MNKGLYLDSFFSTKVNLNDPIELPVDDLFFPVDLRFEFYGEKGNNDYFAFVATPEAMKKHRDFLSEKKVIIVGKDPVKDMINAINSTIRQCSSVDSLAAFSELARFYEWEYDDYRITND